MNFSKYFPTHEQNRMKNEGDLLTARTAFFNMFTEQNRTEQNRTEQNRTEQNRTEQNHVLYHLLWQRFNWMNEYIRPDDENIIEIGCGAGFSKVFIKNEKLILTDIIENPWVEKKEDALALDYPDNSLDIVIASHMIHHLASPYSFFMHLAKKMRVGGRVIIQDMYNSLIMKLVLYIMRHEGWDDTVNVFDWQTVCNQPADPWSANCSIPNLLFSDPKKFEQTFPMFKIIKNEKNECFMFLFSGGVIAKGPRVPLSKALTQMLAHIDKICVTALPQIFACGRSIVIEKR